MKKLLSTLLTAAFLAPAAANAQSSQIATLTHDGEVTLFNGSSGLIDAHKAAADGDIITLSPGTFSGTTITKHITIRGAGMFPEDNGTIINSDLIISTPNIGDTPILNIEGINVSHVTIMRIPNNSIFSKCMISTIQRSKVSVSDVYSINNLSFINCFITKSINTILDYNFSSPASTSFINSVVTNPYSAGTNDSSNLFNNCYIKEVQGDSYFRKYTIKNSIVVIADGYSTLGNSSMSIIHSRIYNAEKNLDTFGTNSSTYTGMPELKDASRYVLSDKLASEALGSDGTQVGIYGGMIPFDPTPSNPQITKFNVASKTSADGKLSVEIEVKSAE